MPVLDLWTIRHLSGGKKHSLDWLLTQAFTQNGVSVVISENGWRKQTSVEQEGHAVLADGCARYPQDHGRDQDQFDQERDERRRRRRKRRGAAQPAGFPAEERGDQVQVEPAQHEDRAGESELCGPEYGPQRPRGPAREGMKVKRVSRITRRDLFADSIDFFFLIICEELSKTDESLAPRSRCPVTVREGLRGLYW